MHKESPRVIVGVCVAVAALALAVAAIALLQRPHMPETANTNAPVVTTPPPQTRPPDPRPDWRLATFGSSGVFRYPEEGTGLTYVQVAEPWPPELRMAPVGDCTAREAKGGEPAQEERDIDGDRYCVRTLREGAAGSTYTTYEYAVDRDEASYRLTFVIRTPQCLNYDQPKRQECQQEQDAFDADAFAVSILHTITTLIP